MNCTNDDRIGRAAAAIAASYGDGTILSRREQAGDLLADLMHWCDAEAVCFEYALESASLDYRAEIREDELTQARLALGDTGSTPGKIQQTKH